MKYSALAFGILSLLALIVAIVGKCVGDPHLFMGTKVNLYFLLSSNLALLGLLADRLFNK